jgi:hypothetical protein
MLMTLAFIRIVLGSEECLLKCISIQIPGDAGLFGLCRESLGYRPCLGL